MMKAADLPQYYNICAILERNLPERRQKIALYSAERSITFQEASDEVNQVGHALKKTDVRFGDCVGILAPDSAEWVTTFFGIAKIGATALGMNTLLKPDEYDYILRDSRVRVIVVHESLLSAIEPIRDQHRTLKQVVVIGNPNRPEDLSFRAWLKGESTELEPEPTHRDDFCSLHYSSGTTGPPKGILHAWCQDTFAKVSSNRSLT
ncbi:AMP-binding protein [Candidatus Entotheonella palauensis]|uniref:AMP-binding protein n=1 Tax=Candidatus Entotheonella palauensis TaxID=93172 RepID=UPI000B7F6CFA|nr:AMP-binding protein [Candidatus Entotheonella palauensis]